MVTTSLQETPTTAAECGAAILNLFSIIHMFKDRENNDVTSYAHIQNYEEDAASDFLLNPRACALDWLARYMQS
jgi:hypothetical protein